MGDQLGAWFLNREKEAESSKVQQLVLFPPPLLESKLTVNVHLSWLMHATAPPPKKKLKIRALERGKGSS